MKCGLLLALTALGFVLPASAQTNIFNCSSGFASSGACGVSAVGSGGQAFALVGGSGGTLSGSQIDFVPTGVTHGAFGFIYQTPINVQAFTSTFTFVPNGQNIAFVIQNNTNTNAGGAGPNFSAGAGCESGFYQAFDTNNTPPNNIFALELDSYSPLTESGSFTYSSAQIYQSGQSPCLPNDAGPNYYPTNKISTSPVNLTNGSQGTSTGDVYSATLTYDGTNLTLNMYNVTTGGSCPGASCFTNVWAVDISSWVGGNTAYLGLTAATGETSTYPLYVDSFKYTVNSGQAAAPQFSPTAGTYSGSQSVTLSTASSGAVICYNTTGSPVTNGSSGCATGTLYAGPVTISSSETLYAVAGGTGYKDSSVGSASYVIQSSVATPAFLPVGGNYPTAQQVTIADAISNATIYYTTNGTTPATSSTRYTGPIAVSSTETLEAIAVAPGGANSAVASATYNITATILTPSFSPTAGSYTSAQSVTISDFTSDTTIYYTTNGTTPTTSSTAYNGPITVSSSETLEAIAVAASDTSAVASAAYLISTSLPSVSTPTFSPAAGAYTSAQSVTISDATSGATIYYTTDGTTPTTSSTAYTGPIPVSATETLEVIAAATGDSNSAVASAAYTIASTLPSVSTPSFSPAGGTYPSAQLVNISDATSGATIYYTTNGTTPTSSSTKYSGPITVSSPETLEAIAVATGDSAVASAAYTITSQPNFVLGTSTASLTVNSGGQGTVTLTVTPENGFDSPVILACSALPSWATCSFNQETVTPSGGAVSTQLTISASVQSSALRPESRPVFPFTALAMTVCVFGWRKRRGRHHWVLLAVVYGGLGLLFGCGGTNAGDGTSAPSTATPTTSTVTVTAISGPLQGTAAIALTVN
jgi:hypothetical protein